MTKRPPPPDTYSSIGLLVLRVGISAMMLTHGWPKLANFAERAATFSDPIGLGSTISLILAISAEFVCSIALMIGAGTRFVAGPLLFTMLVAALIVHAGDPWSKKEHALLYAVPYVTLIFCGAGKYSVDYLVRRRK